MRSIQPDSLASLIGYQLHLTALEVTHEARLALVGLGITPAKVAALVFVRDNPGCDQSRLGRLLDINRSSAMKLIDGLERLSLVERRPGKDRRSNGLHLTPAGEQALGDAIVRLAQSEAAFAADLSAGERSEFLRLLHKVRTGARRARASGRGSAAA